MNSVNVAESRAKEQKIKAIANDKDMNSVLEIEKVILGGNDG